MTPSTLTDFSVRATKSITEPAITGTRIAIPSTLPSSSGSTREVAIAAPVVVGTMAARADLPRRRFFIGESTTVCELVTA